MIASSEPLLDIVFEDPRWRRMPKLRARLEAAARQTQASLPKGLQFPFTATLLLTDDKQIKQLNRDFRGINKATNVLSFPQFDDLKGKTKAKEPVPLGDIAVAYLYVVGEAEKNDKLLINHITHLLIHGILHLFGYDHVSDAEAVRMERLEKKIMTELGLPDPYLDVPPQKKMPINKHTHRK